MRIEEIEKNIDFLSRILIELKKESITDDELIFKKYIELESLPKVKLFIQDKGIRTTRGTIYQAKDLSEIIQSTPSHINKDIINFAHKIFNSNNKIINKLYN